MIVLDASVLIAHFDVTDVHHDRATTLLLDATGDELAASPISIAEVLVGPARAGRLDEAVAALRDLDVASVSLDDDSPARLAALRAETGLRLPDCCVLLAGQQARGAVATFDDGLAAAAGRRGLATQAVPG